MVGAFPRPIACATRAALHHRHHAGRSADRCLQQDHRAESVHRREARDDLFLARGRLEQERQLHPGDRGCREAIRLHPSVAAYNLRGSAYHDKGEDDIAIADFNDALRIGPPSGIIFHNRGNAWRSKGEYAKAIADYDQSIKLGPPSAFSWQNRGISKRALGDLDGALADINEAIRIDPTLPQPLTSRAVIWRAKGDLDRAIADTTEAIRLAKAKAPVNIMTPPGSVLNWPIAIAPSPMKPRAISTAPSRITPRRSKARPPTPAARPTRRPRKFACRCFQKADRLRRDRRPSATAEPAKPRRLRRRAQRARPRLPQRSRARAQTPAEKPAGASRW